MRSLTLVPILLLPLVAACTGPITGQGPAGAVAMPVEQVVGHVPAAQAPVYQMPVYQMPGYQAPGYQSVYVAGAVNSQPGDNVGRAGW